MFAGYGILEEPLFSFSLLMNSRNCPLTLAVALWKSNVGLFVFPVKGDVYICGFLPAADFYRYLSLIWYSKTLLRYIYVTFSLYLSFWSMMAHFTSVA